MTNYKLHFGRYNKSGNLEESKVANVTLSPNKNISLEEVEKRILLQLGPDWLTISRYTLH